MEMTKKDTMKKVTLPENVSTETVSTEKKESVVSKESIVLSAIEIEVLKRLSGSVKHGDALESRKYEICFLATKENDCTFSRFGSVSNSTREDFPHGKYLISDGKIYSGMGKMKIWNSDKTRYTHYVNNAFHVFVLPTAIEKNAEITELKRLESLNVQRANEEKKEGEKKKGKK